MKKINVKHLNTDAKEMLTRAQLKNVLGGNHEITTIDGGENGKNYKCCWKSQPTNCSECVTNAKPECVADAKAVPC